VPDPEDSPADQTAHPMLTQPTGRTELTEAERELAALLGVDTEFLDWQRTHTVVPPATIRAVLTALGADVSSRESAVASLDALHRERSGRLIPPCLVLAQGQPLRLADLPAGTQVTLGLEDGTSRVLEIHAPTTDPLADLPLGYHTLRVRPPDADESTCSLIVTPVRLDLDRLLGSRRAWGLALQLYSVPSERSWALGDLADLGTLAAWSAADHGADYLLVNPLAAAQPIPPMEPSPYLPTTRLFTNPVYLRVEDVPEYPALPGAVRDRQAARSAALRSWLHTRDRIDRDAVWSAKREALEDLFAVPVSPERQQQLADFVQREGIALIDFATWCTLAEVYGDDWRHWPLDLQDPRSVAVSEFTAEWSARVAFHLWLQWLADEQLAQAQHCAIEAGMRLGIMHDLAVGVHPTGADAWMFQHTIATGINVGAPPDAFNQVGQDWSQPPWRPDALERLAYEPFRQLVARLLRHAGGLRIDHVIGLFRLWWIPKGRPAAEGTYVHYDHEALLGILLLEAERAGAVLVGEDLGNVEPAARQTLADKAILGTSVLWFERDGEDPQPPEAWRRDSLATVTTHDLPPTSGYLLGDHVRLRDALGLLTRSVEEEQAAADAERASWLATLRERALLGDNPDEDDVVAALHTFVASTSARLVGVALTDAVGERLTQNQPGTSDEHPNWRVPLHGPDGRQVSVEGVMTSARVARLLTVVAAAVPSHE
jgi:4-alpha-glucanotransferase